MDYREEYLKTVEQLFFATRELEKQKRHEDTAYRVLIEQAKVIDGIWANLEKMTGPRLENAEKMLKGLVFVYNRIGAVYMAELKWRKQLNEAQKSLLEAAEKINVLENQLKATEEL